jgi:hypothetical protein
MSRTFGYSAVLLLWVVGTALGLEKQKSFLDGRPLGDLAVAGKLDVDLHAEYMMSRTFKGDIVLNWYNCGFSGGGQSNEVGGNFGDFGMHVHYTKRAKSYPRAIKGSLTQAAQFSGGNMMKANFPVEDAVAGSEDMAIEVWVRDTKPARGEVILGWQSDDGKASSAPLTYPSAFKGSNKWRHLVVNCEATKETWYLDGKKVSTSARRMKIAKGHSLVLGGAAWGKASFSGDLAAVRVHEKAMTTAGITHNFKGGVMLGTKRHAWWRLEKDKWWAKESPHFRHCIDVKDMAKWDTKKRKGFDERVPKMFALAEKTFYLYTERLALRAGVVSSRPEFRGDGIKYNIPIQPTKGGNYMGWDAKRGFGWSCQGPGYINPHEFVHGCQGQTGTMQGNYWEAHANFPQTYLGIYQTVPPLFVSRVSMFFPANGRVYYHARLMFEHLAQTPEYGPMFVSKLWYDNGTKGAKHEYPWAAFVRLKPGHSTPLSYEWTLMAQKCVTWDYEIYGDKKPKTLYKDEAAKDKDQMLRHGRTLLKADPYHKGWLRPPMSMAPQQLGFNVCPLQVTGGEVSVEIDGLIHKERGSDWRAAFVGVDAAGKPIYGPVTGPGKKTTFKTAGAKQLFLVVTATPKKILGIDMVGDFRSFEKERFPYRVRLSGCKPLDLLIPSKPTEKGSKHRNGGGFVAATAKVDATAYVGPNAQVLGKAKVLGKARVEDYAVVKEDATVQDSAQVSGHAMVRGRAIVRDYARLRDYALVTRTTVKDNARIMEHAAAGGGCREVSGNAIIKGVAWADGKVLGTAMVDGSYRKRNEVDNGVWLTWSWSAGQNAGEMPVELGGLFAQYLFETKHPYLAWDTFGVTHGIMHGNPTTKVYADRKKTKTYEYPVKKKKSKISKTVAGTSLVLNGKDQFIELAKSVGDRRDMSLVVTFKHSGGKPNQRLVEFAADAKTRLFLTPADTGGRPRFTITMGGKTQTLRSSVPLPRGKWVELLVTLRGDTGTLKLNGKTVATSKAMTLNPEDLRAALCTIGRGLEGNFFAGELEGVSFYSVPLTDK